MSPKTLLCILPRVPPAVDGIGDYTFRLLQHWPRDESISWHFLTHNWKDVEPGRWGKATFGELPIGAGDLDDVIERSGCRQLILHYVGYGYHSHGMPLSLVAGIINWRKRKPDRQLVIFFHELWSSGPPWSSVYYVSWLQSFLVRRLHRQSDLVITSTRRMQLMLEAIQPKKTLLLPVPSNVAVLGDAKLKKRWPLVRDNPLRVLIFGQKGPRLRSVQTHAALLRELERRSCLHCVIIVGKEASAKSEDVSALARILPAERIHVRGVLSDREIAAVFNEADIFLSFYPASLLTKSTAAMSALANGCPVVLSDASSPEPLSYGDHFLVCDGSTRGISGLLSDLENGVGVNVSKLGRQWYNANADWPVVADKWSKALSLVSP